MLKRTSKITALLVAATSIMTMVPAMAADNARVGNKEGTVKQGIAYDNGAYAYYGYRNDTYDTGVWFNKGGDEKDYADSDLADYRFNNDSKYGTKYAYAKENSNDDEYLVDLSTGKIVTDETAEEKSDVAQANLTSKIKKADRYKNVITTTTDLDGRFDQILKGQFGDVWFKYNTDIAGTSHVGEVKGTIELTVPDFNASSITIAGVKINKTTVTGTAGYTAGSASSFAVQAASEKTSFVNGFDFTSVDPATGVITLTQTAAGPFVQADLDTMAANTGSTSNASLQLVTAGQAPGVVLVAGQKAVIKVTPANLTKDVKATGVVIPVAVADKTGYTDKAGLINAIKTASYDNYTAVVTDVTGTNSLKVKLTQKVGATLNQSTISNSDYESVTGVTVTQTGLAGTSTSGAKGYIGFADEKGNYIDASYNANMRVYSTVKGRAVMVDKYDDEVEDAGLTVSLDSLEAIAQDKDNIYALAHVTVTGTGAAEANQVFLQKISKAQGGKDAEDAYVPKSVTSYQLDTKNIYDNGDMEDAVKAIEGTKDSDYKYLIGMEVKDGSLYVTRASEDSVKVYKLDMKNVKSDIVSGVSATLKTDVDTNALVFDDGSDTDIVKHTTAEAATAEDEGLKGIEKVTDRVTGNIITLAGQEVMRHPGVSIDVDGNTWALDKGQIKMFTKLDAKNVNTCDRAIDAIDAYNAKSVIAWETDGDVYTTLSEGVKVTETDGINVNPDINKDKFKNGYNATEKKFYKDGVAVVNQWASDDAGKWYFLGTDGVAKTGWYQNASGTWYLLDATTGAMLTGWQQEGGSWYYLNPVNSNGAMLSNTVVDGYTLGANGAWVK
jgi:glucan-binding YG repeat protein